MRQTRFSDVCDDPQCLELFRVAGESGLPVVLHLDVPYSERRTDQSERCYESP